MRCAVHVSNKSKNVLVERSPTPAVRSPRLLQCVLAVESYFSSDFPVYVVPVEVVHGATIKR